MANRYYSAISQDTQLTAPITAAATSMTVTALVGYPHDYPYVVAVDFNTANEELMLVTAAAGSTLTVVRANAGGVGSVGTAVSHATGATVRHVITAQDMTDAQNHYSSTTNVHGIADTSQLTTQDQVQAISFMTMGA